MHFTDIITPESKVAVLTGAGISTDSGIPDYRDAKGNWKRKQPVQHQDFMNSLYSRQRFWARSLIGWPVMRDAQPNESHKILTNLEKAGIISCLITQNVDGLHQKAGHQKVTDLHGRSDRVICTNCQQLYSRDEVHHWMAELNPDFLDHTAESAPDGDADLEDVEFDQFKISECPECGSVLKPDVVFFGDNVEKATVESAKREIEKSDVLLVIGSSLMVYSGYRFCKHAHQLNKPILIINQGTTRADQLAHIKIDDDIGTCLKKLFSEIQNIKL